VKEAGSARLFLGVLALNEVAVDARLCASLQRRNCLVAEAVDMNAYSFVRGREKVPEKGRYGPGAGSVLRPLSPRERSQSG